jgi:flagella basal body P-ring formation protein FlgA
MNTRVKLRRRRRAGAVYGAAIVAAAALACSAAGDEITLKGSVRLETGAKAVRLVDIAELAGPLAHRYAETVIAEVSGGTEALEITVSQVRRMLAEAGAHWGKIQLNGRNVIVRPAVGCAAAPPMAMTPVSIEPKAKPRRANAPRTTYEMAVDLIGLPTLRGTVARLIADGLGVDPEKLRLVFDDRNTSLLDTHENAFRFEIQPLGNLNSDRIELSVRAWSEGRIQQRHMLTVRLMINTDVTVLRRDISRGEQLHEEDLSVEARWLVPSQAGTMSSMIEAVGRVADTRLKAGDALRASHIKREQVIKRGDRVMVRCLVGGIVISLEAEARSEGAEGDQIELRKLGERDTFMATATGRGSAVVDLSR